jgi:hypothetical protein
MQKYLIFFHFDFVFPIILLLENIPEFQNEDRKSSRNTLLKNQNNLFGEPLAEPRVAVYSSSLLSKQWILTRHLPKPNAIPTVVSP